MPVFEPQYHNYCSYLRKIASLFYLSFLICKVGTIIVVPISWSQGCED